MAADPAFAVLQAEWARLLIGSLADAGVRDVVISPGSRSTPFVLAAARHPGLRCWDLIDERSAAFFALGKARATGLPALVLCTSGTAAANYLPAVVEAGAAGVPLLVLTADRPVELTDCGAHQTIDQLKLYGGHARRFVDLGSPCASPHALRALRRAAAQAFFTCRHPEPGAVHLNARAAKPLEPQAPRTAAEECLRAEVDRLLAKPIAVASAPAARPRPEDVAELAELCRGHERGLVVCGPAPMNRSPNVRRLAVELAALTHFPLYCEPASQGRFWRRPQDVAVHVDALDALLHGAAFRAGMAPELIVQIGRPPTSKVWERWLEEHPERRHWVIDAHRWSDSRSTADHLLICDPEHALEALVERISEATVRLSADWARRFREAEEIAWTLADAELAGGELTEGAVARAVVAGLPDGALLAVGNSLPIRALDTWCRGGGKELSVWSQRGASGIDGVVSGAAGAASEHPGPGALLVGDLSFLHDLSGLAAARRLERPFVVVVVQNRGGRIFEQLPLAADESVAGGIFDHWTTPHDYDFAHAAALFGLPFERAETLGELRAAVARALRHDGATVVEAVVPPHGAAEQNRRLWRAVDAASTCG